MLLPSLLFAADPLFLFATLALGLGAGSLGGLLLGASLVFDLLDPVGFEVLELFERDQG